MKERRKEDQRKEDRRRTGGGVLYHGKERRGLDRELSRGGRTEGKKEFMSTRYGRRRWPNRRKRGDK